MQGQAGRLVVATGLLRSPDGVIGQTVWIRQGFPSARKRGLDRPNRLPRQKLSWTAKQAHEERELSCGGRMSWKGRLRPFLERLLSGIEDLGLTAGAVSWKSRAG